MQLSLFIIVPLLTAIGIFFCKEQKQVRWLALSGSIVQLLMAVYLALAYSNLPGGTDGMQFETTYAWFRPLGINYRTGVDGISIAMILLTAFVVPAGILVSWKVEKMHREFFILILLLSTGAYGFFIALDLFTLFFFLELAVIPKFLLIGIWGSGKKEYSALKLALMLMGGSALVFIGLAGLYIHTGSFDMTVIAQQTIPVAVQRLFFPFAFLGFGIFTALFPFHTWVPDGHAAAPTAASMFLAGISMKLGGYGCLRVASYLMPDAAHYYSWIIILLATIAIIYGAFATMMQKDLKYINAYSSVSHCGFVLLGIGMLTRTSINGAVLQMVSHGLMTALFFAAIGMIYERTHTRMLDKLGGLLKITPFISTVFVIAGLCSLGLPGMSGFVAEMTVIMGAWESADGWYRLATILACASLVVTAVYILRAAGSTVMGPLQPGVEGLRDAGWQEKFAAGILITGILTVGIAPFLITKLIAPGTGVIAEKILQAAS